MSTFDLFSKYEDNHMPLRHSKSSQITFIYIALLTIWTVSKQLYSGKTEIKVTEKVLALQQL